MTKVSKRYGMSNNGLRKVCRSMNIPFPDRGYWAKVQAGKPVSKTPLPKIKPPQVDRMDLPKTGAERELQISEDALSFLKSRDREKVLKAARKVRVAGPGSSLYKDIEKHRQECEDWLERERKVRTGEYPWRYQVDPPLFADTMSKSSYIRAFHILDAPVKALIPFGGGLAYDFSMKVNGEAVKFSISEAKDYESAPRIRAYADARERAGDADAEWRQWAREKADWLDPTVARKDEFFGQRQHGNAPKYKDPEKKW